MSGKTRNPFKKRVYGHGYIGVGPHRSSVNGRQTDAYCIWFSMMKRVYSEKNHLKYPSYKGCSVCNEWHNFQVFAEWFYQQPNHDKQGFHLDKDLIILGNRTYSPDACSFVPQEINKVLSDCRVKRGQWPAGVYKNKGFWKASIRINGSKEYLGIYRTPDEAYNVYKQAKEKYVREQAEKYKDVIHPTVYQNLKNWELGEL